MVALLLKSVVPLDIPLYDPVTEQGEKLVPFHGVSFSCRVGKPVLPDLERDSSRVVAKVARLHGIANTIPVR
jgi:hypothetical protein